MPGSWTDPATLAYARMTVVKDIPSSKHPSSRYNARFAFNLADPK